MSFKKQVLLLESKALLYLQLSFPYKSSYSLKNSDCHKFSVFNDGGLKLRDFGIFDALFPFLAFFKL